MDAAVQTYINWDNGQRLISAGWGTGDGEEYWVMEEHEGVTTLLRSVEGNMLTVNIFFPCRF
mgnify:CR=1 FL=1